MEAHAIFPLICLLFAHRANGSLWKLVVCPFVYKETNGRYIRTKRTYPFMLSGTKKYASTGIITGMLNFS
jgi:hypothetical protein